MQASQSTPNNLREKFVGALTAVYQAEHHTIRSLPVIIQAAQNAELKSILNSHLEEAELHIERLERTFTRLNEPLPDHGWLGIHAAMAAGADVLMNEAGDRALIDSCNVIAQNEMDTYETLVSCATLMDLKDIAVLLQLTLIEEKAFDASLKLVSTRLVPGKDDAKQS